MWIQKLQSIILSDCDHINDGGFVEKMLHNLRF